MVKRESGRQDPCGGILADDQVNLPTVANHTSKWLLLHSACHHLVAVYYTTTMSVIFMFESCEAKIFYVQVFGIQISGGHLHIN